jgi:hypothetical protein
VVDWQFVQWRSQTSACRDDVVRNLQKLIEADAVCVVEVVFVTRPRHQAIQLFDTGEVSGEQYRMVIVTNLLLQRLCQVDLYAMNEPDTLFIAEHLF